MASLFLLLGLLCSVPLRVLCLAHPTSNSSCDFSQTTEDGRTVIPVGVLAAKGAESPSTIDVFPAVQLAMDIINNRSDLLPGYFLEPCFKASECSWRPALSDLFDVIDPSLEDPSRTRPLFIIGTGCSPRTEPISQVNQFMNMLTISYFSSSPNLANSSLFPLFFRLELNEEISNLAQVSFIANLNFTNQRVGVFLQDFPLFTAAWSKMRLRMMQYGIQSTLVRFSETTLKDRLNDLFDDPPAMFVVNAYESQARIIFCEALKRGLVYPRYGWVFTGWYGNQWWENERFSSNCGNNKLARFLPFTITVETQAKPDNFSMPTDVELTPEQFQLKFEKVFKKSSKVNHNLTTPDRITGKNRNAYDSTWTLALALNASLEELASMNLTLAHYDHFSPASQVIVRVVRHHLSRLDFTGVSGRVAFNGSSGDRVAYPATVSQFRMVDGTLTSDEVGQIVQTEFVPNDSLTWEAIFPDGVPRRQTTTTSIGLFIPLAVVTILATILSIFFIIFTIAYKNRRVVKAASPVLNIASALGSLVLYAMVIMLTFPNRDPLVHTVVKCNLVVWLILLGEILVFAPLVLKSWRVYRIYHHPSVTGKVVSNWKLLMILLAILSVGVVLLVVITAVPQTRREAGEELVQGDLRLSCMVPDESVPYAIPFIVLALYFSLLLILGLFFAFQTRNIKIKALIESRQIASAILVEALLMVLVYPVVTLVTLPVDVANGYTGFALIAKNVVIMCLLFLPKVYYVWVKKDGGNVEVWTSEELGGLHRATLASMQAEIDHLKSEVDSYKSILNNVCHDGRHDGRSLQSTLSHYESHEESHDESHDKSHDLVYHDSEVLVTDNPPPFGVHRKTWGGTKRARQYQLVSGEKSGTMK